MTIHDTFAGAQYITAILDLANENKMMIEMGSDFELYAQYINEHRKDQPLGAPFDPALHDLNEDNAFWIAGWSPEGELVHTQAMRRFALGGLSLADHLAQNFRAFPPSGMDLDMEASNYTPGPGAKRMRGTICYHGEVWVRPDGRYRGTGLPGALARFALATCNLRWSPDHIFGFMPERHAFRGLMEREGYMHSDPGALNWHVHNSDDVLRGFMIYMGREDLSHLITLPPRENMTAQAA